MSAPPRGGTSAVENFVGQERGLLDFSVWDVGRLPNRGRDTWACPGEVRGQACAGWFRRSFDFEMVSMRIRQPVEDGPPEDWAALCPDCRERYRLLGFEEPAPANADALGVDLG